MIPSRKSLIDDATIRESVEKLIESGEWAHYDGEASRSLVALLSNEHRRPHVQLCCSGTIGIELALRGLRIGPGDEVALGAYDFPGNFRAIEAVGAKPVLIDLAERSWCLDPGELAKAASPTLKAVVVSHLHGTLAEMGTITTWAREHGISVIEDACQAHGAVLQGDKVGNFGDVSVLSFGGSKLISSGRGGAILTSDPLIDQRIRVYRERGNDAFAMSELQSCVIAPQWYLLNQQNEQRWNRVRSLESSLGDAKLVSFPHRSSGDRPSFYKWGLWINGSSDKERLEFRKGMIEQLQAHGIQAGEGFRGFALRSSQRCRAVGDLERARVAASGTLLIHHLHLLGKIDSSTGTEDPLGQALRKGMGLLRS